MDSEFVISPTSLNLFVTPESVLAVLLQSFTDMHRAAENLSPDVHVPS